jgi:hypothetical protein
MSKASRPFGATQQWGASVKTLVDEMLCSRSRQANRKVTSMTPQPLPQDDQTGSEAPRKGRRRSYDESVDEPAKLISDEPVDIEKETPAEENEPIERLEPDDPPLPPAFEDDMPSD